jgi:hypothetical protein
MPRIHPTGFLTISIARVHSQRTPATKYSLCVPSRPSCSKQSCGEHFVNRKVAEGREGGLFGCRPAGNSMPRIHPTGFLTISIARVQSQRIPATKYSLCVPSRPSCSKGSCGKHFVNRKVAKEREGGLFGCRPVRNSMPRIHPTGFLTISIARVQIPAAKYSLCVPSRPSCSKQSCGEHFVNRKVAEGREGDVSDFVRTGPQRQEFTRPDSRQIEFPGFICEKLHDELMPFAYLPILPVQKQEQMK